MRCITVILAVCALLLTGCVTTKRTGTDILEYQRQAALLEARVGIYERAVGDAISELEKLGERAANIDGTVDELICLFDDYQRAIERLLRYYKEAGGAAEVQD